MTASKLIYLDNNATTPLDPRVLQAMMPYLTTEFGNPGSRHELGRRAADAVDRSREQVARLLGATPEEVIFTSSATESINLAIKGAVDVHRDRSRHVITCRTEHKAVIEVCHYLERNGVSVTWLKPDNQGRVTVEQVAEAIRPDTILITLMAANNETGTLHPVAQIGRLARERSILFHTDAAQATGRVPLSVVDTSIDLLSLSAHKLYGPKGVGALFVRRGRPRVRLACQLHGGGQEHDLRSGTLNVAGIVGLGAAAELARLALAEESRELAGLRDRLHEALTSALDGVTLNGHPEERLPNTLNLSFAGVDAEKLMARMPTVAVSSGSACTSALLTPSHVLRTMGLGEDQAHSAVRLSLGRFTSARDVDRAAAEVIRVVRAIRRAGSRRPASRQCDCRNGCCR
jgi:cysteine desulfurase